MARNSSAKKTLASKMAKKTRPGVKRKPATPGIAKSLYQLFVALPFIPAPLKAGADFVMRQLGYSLKSNGYTLACPTILYGFTEILANTVALGSEKIVLSESQSSCFSNYTTARPKRIVIKIQPSNPLAKRSGFLTAAFIPYTSINDSTTFKNLSMENIGFSRFIQRAPVKRRCQATRSITLVYNVPASNMYLHGGLKLGNANTSQPIGAFYVAYECDQRCEYNNFTADEFGLNVSVIAMGQLLAPDPIALTEIPNNAGCNDLIPDSIPLAAYRDVTTKKIVHGTFEYDTSSKCLKATGEVKLLEAGFEHVPPMRMES